MSTLTKICVVVLVALVLFASGPFIQQAVTGPDWKQKWQDEEKRAEVAEASDRNAKMIGLVYKDLYEDAHEKAVADARQHLIDIGSKDVAVARLTSQLADRAGEVRKLAAFNEAFEIDLRAQIATNKGILSQMDSMRFENGKLTDQLRQAQHTIKEEQTNREILTRSVKSLQEQIVQKNTMIAELNDQLASGGVSVGTGRPVVAKGVKIDATVTAIKNDLASLNIGSASGVVKDMEFIIYRGENFVALLQIADVGVANSTGIIMDRKRELKVGDKASTNLE
ncbi:MAG: hypothetical protein K8R91_04160 [Phycisphaerae bacterium]|nr:hypothetical protein [Phycisphaerae bacterium]